MRNRSRGRCRRAVPLVLGAAVSTALAVPLPGGTLNPTTIPKYVTPLVIPPVMNDNGRRNHYDIAMRQFQQQILPGGIWDTVGGTSFGFPATTVFSYGPDADPTPAVAPDPASQFNYPAYTIETLTNPRNRPAQRVRVRWLNELVADPDACKASPGSTACNFLPHPLPIDQGVHWANPPQDCLDGIPRTDCRGSSQILYTGPIPMVTHLHGAHVEGHSDGYPEAWWLPAASDIPTGYATSGTLYDDAFGGPGDRGLADYVYRNDQPATTLWFHDHALGMTRENVYIGPAGFWLVRGGRFDKVADTRTRRLARLPGPAPVAGQGVLELNVPGDPVRGSIREIPIVIQDRSFNANGSLYYPANRAFFEGLGDGVTPSVAGNNAAGLQIPFVPNSDILATWNPEAFFNTMVVNGVTWPNLGVAPARYRLRLLNGCNSRFLNLALRIVTGPGTDGVMGTGDDVLGADVPFYQIGAEQGFLPRVVRISTGEATVLPGNGTSPAPTPTHPQQALLLALAERADVIVDFGDLPDGTVVRMTNTAPDAPFGGFPDDPADAGTTGQVMQFTVDSTLRLPSDARTTSPLDMRPITERPLKAKDVAVTRRVSLNEEVSGDICVAVDDNGEFSVPIINLSQPPCATGTDNFGPKAALLGTVSGAGATASGNPLLWTDTTGASLPVPVTLQSGITVEVNVTENPTVGDTEDWEIYNFTEDAHPIHMHLVRYEVLGRTALDGTASVVPTPSGAQAWESGFKDTVISYPGEITRIRARFDVAGLYVWHCHILEHEDNEMMRPYVVSP